MFSTAELGRQATAPIHFFMLRFRWSSYLSLLALSAFVSACTTSRPRALGQGACLDADWRTAVMEVWLRHQATDTVDAGARHFQRTLGIAHAAVPPPTLVREDRVCRVALGAFDRVDPRPDRVPRAHGYVFRFGSHFVVRDPTDERRRPDRWAYAAVFRTDWTYVFYQGFYRCTGGTWLTGEVDCAGGP